MSQPKPSTEESPANYWVPTRRHAVRVALCYALFGVMWVGGSGWLLHQVVRDEALAALLEDVKGWLFVLVTALLFGWVLDRYFLRIRRSVQLLRDQEARLHLVGDNLPDSYVYQYTLLPGGRPQFSYISAGVERVHGIKVADVLADSNCLMAQADPAQLAAIYEGQKKGARDLTDFQMEFPVRRPDGTIRLLQVRSRPRRTADGHVLWDGFAQDVTAHRQAEEALRQSEAKWRSYIERAPVGVLVADKSGRHVEANRCAEEMLGYEPGGLIGTGIMDLPARENGDALRQHLEQLESNGQSDGQFLLRRKDGRMIWAQVKASRIDGGRMLGIIQDITEPKRTEEALRASESRFSTIFHASPAAMGISRLDDGRFLNVNEAFLQLYGYTREELVGHTSEELGLWHSGNRARAVEELREKRHLHRIELQGRRKNGEICDLLASLELVELGGVPHLLGSLIDMTDRRKAEAALRLSEENFRTMFEVASVGMAQAKLHTGQWVRVNRRMCEITGYSEQEMLQLRVSEVTHPEDRARDWELFQQVVRGEAPNYHIEKRYVRKDGSIAWVSVNMALVRDAAGQPVRAMATIEDITERRRTEEALRLRSAALEAAANAIVITNRDGTIEWANPAFTKSTGYTLEEAIGKNPRFLRSGKHDKTFYQDLWSTVLAGKIWQNEMINRRKDGSLFHEEMTVTPVRDGRGEVLHFVAIRQDITARKRLEEQLLQSQKMEAIGQLAGGVAHDFNNLLAAMMMQAEAAAMAENLPEDVRDGLQQIRAAVERAAKLTRQLLLFSRKQVMQMRDLDLNDVVTSLAKMLQRIIGEDIRLQLHLCPLALMTRADAGMLDQILMNLAVNARDAMPEGGCLRIETGEETFDTESKELPPDAAPGRHVWLRVTDSGCGIPPEVLPRIFEPFFTTKEVGKGTGLGLATVFGIVKQHRGWIKADSKPGAGASFQIYFPAVKTVAVVEEEFSPPQPRGGTETILLAEDDAALREVTRRLLEKCGYEVLEAGNGPEAVRIWEEHGSAVALLLTDMVMPAGMSGRDLARKLQMDRPNLKVIFTTGYSSELAGRGIQLLQGENFVQKPCPPDELLESIRRSLDN